MNSTRANNTTRRNLHRSPSVLNLTTLNGAQSNATRSNRFVQVGTNNAGAPVFNFGAFTRRNNNASRPAAAAAGVGARPARPTGISFNPVASIRNLGTGVNRGTLLVNGRNTRTNLARRERNRNNANYQRRLKERVNSHIGSRNILLREATEAVWARLIANGMQVTLNAKNQAQSRFNLHRTVSDVLLERFMRSGMTPQLETLEVLDSDPSILSVSVVVVDDTGTMFDELTVDIPISEFESRWASNQERNYLNLFNSRNFNRNWKRLYGNNRNIEKWSGF
jgi:hypothetical protein